MFQNIPDTQTLFSISFFFSTVQSTHPICIFPYEYIGAVGTCLERVKGYLCCLNELSSWELRLHRSLATNQTEENLFKIYF